MGAFYSVCPWVLGAGVITPPVVHSTWTPPRSRARCTTLLRTDGSPCERGRASHPRTGAPSPGIRETSLTISLPRRKASDAPPRCRPCAAHADDRARGLLDICGGPLRRLGRHGPGAACVPGQSDCRRGLLLGGGVESARDEVS